MPPRRVLPFLAALSISLAFAGALGIAFFGLPERRESAARAAVDGQLEAFGRGDFAAAYKYASSGIRDAYPDVASFEEMIYGAYPEFGATEDWEIVDALVAGDRAAVEVAVRMPAKPYRHFKYYLSREGGEWKVDGVTLLDRAAPEGDTKI